MEFMGHLNSYFSVMKTTIILQVEDKAILLSFSPISDLIELNLIIYNLNLTGRTHITLFKYTGSGDNCHFGTLLRIQSFIIFPNDLND